MNLSVHVVHSLEKRNLRKKFSGDIISYNREPIIDDFRKTVSSILNVSYLVENGEEIIQVLSEETIVNPDKIFQLYQTRANRIFSFSNAPVRPYQQNWFIESGFFWK